MKPISDNSCYVKLADEIAAFEAVHKLLSVFNLSDQDKAQIEKIKADVDKARHLPDQFNQYYASRGWIAFESMNAPLMERCVELAKKQDEDKGELCLIDYYMSDDAKYLLYPLKNRQGFSERYELLKLAYEDFRNERYHACVPIFLMMLDGVVNQVAKTNKGFFAENVDLTLWDSIVGHESGLGELAKIFSKNRKTTCTEKITLPYRNGILHGQDLGYGNKFVATKSLAALYAVGDWVKQLLDGKHMPPASVPPKGLWAQIKDDLKSIQKYRVQQQKPSVERSKLDKWKPRKPGTVNLSLDNIQQLTPEEKVIELLSLWKKKNYGKIASILTDLSHKTTSQLVKDVRSCLDGRKLEKFELIAIEDQAAAASYITTNVVVTIPSGEEIIHDLKFRVLYQKDANGSPLVRTNPDGSWFILEAVIWDIFNLDIILLQNRLSE